MKKIVCSRFHLGSLEGSQCLPGLPEPWSAGDSQFILLNQKLTPFPMNAQRLKASLTSVHFLQVAEPWFSVEMDRSILFAAPKCLVTHELSASIPQALPRVPGCLLGRRVLMHRRGCR